MLKTSYIPALVVSALVVSALIVTSAGAQEHSVEIIDAAPEAEGVSEEIAKQIADEGIRVKRGSTRTVCETALSTVSFPAVAGWRGAT